MLIINHSGIFRVEKRLREFGEFKLPGDGITYSQLWGGVIGGFAASPILLLTWLLSTFIISGGLGKLIIWVIGLGLVTLGAYIGGQIVGKKERNGDNPIKNMTRWVTYRRTPKRIINGEPFTPTKTRHTFELIINNN